MIEQPGSSWESGFLLRSGKTGGSETGVRAAARTPSLHSGCLVNLGVVVDPRWPQAQVSPRVSMFVPTGVDAVHESWREMGVPGCRGATLSAPRPDFSIKPLEALKFTQAAGR